MALAAAFADYDGRATTQHPCELLGSSYLDRFCFCTTRDGYGRL
jgi:hypothetical protein